MYARYARAATRLLGGLITLIAVAALSRPAAGQPRCELAPLLAHIDAQLAQGTALTAVVAELVQTCQAQHGFRVGVRAPAARPDRDVAYAVDKEFAIGGLHSVIVALTAYQHGLPDRDNDAANGPTQRLAAEDFALFPTSRTAIESTHSVYLGQHSLDQAPCLLAPEPSRGSLLCQMLGVGDDNYADALTRIVGESTPGSEAPKLRGLRLLDDTSHRLGMPGAAHAPVREWTLAYRTGYLGRTARQWLAAATGCLPDDCAAPPLGSAYRYVTSYVLDPRLSPDVQRQRVVTTYAEIHAETRTWSPQQVLDWVDRHGYYRPDMTTAEVDMWTQLAARLASRGTPGEWGGLLQRLLDGQLLSASDDQALSRYVWQGGDRLDAERIARDYGLPEGFRVMPRVRAVRTYGILALAGWLAVERDAHPQRYDIPLAIFVNGAGNVWPDSDEPRDRSGVVYQAVLYATVQAYACDLDPSLVVCANRATLTPSPSPQPTAQPAARAYLPSLWSGYTMSPTYTPPNGDKQR
jgi:hypothetical protein